MNNNIFDRRLKAILSASGVERGELARHLGVSVPTVKLGLSPETVEALLELAGSESEEVLTAVDDAVCALIATINAVYGDLLAIAENSGG